MQKLVLGESYQLSSCRAPLFSQYRWAPERVTRTRGLRPLGEDVATLNEPVEGDLSSGFRLRCKLACISASYSAGTMQYINDCRHAGIIAVGKCPTLEGRVYYLVPCPIVHAKLTSETAAGPWSEDREKVGVGDYIKQVLDVILRYLDDSHGDLYIHLSIT